MKYYSICKYHIALVSNKLNVPFFSMLFQWDKNCNCFQVYFWSVLKLSVNFGNHISQDSQEPICNFGFTDSQYSATCWSNLPLKCCIFLMGNTRRSNSITWSSWFCMGPVTTCWYDSIIKWRHRWTSVYFIPYRSLLYNKHLGFDRVMNFI